MPNLMSMKFLRGCFVGYCNFAKSNEGRFPAGDRILGKVLMTIRRPSLQCGHLVSRVMINAESTNTHITIGHYMKRESTQKLFAGQWYRFLLCPVPVVFSYESYVCWINVQDPLVADGNAMGVLPQIPDNMLGTCHRGLAIDHPLFLMGLL